MIRVRDASLYLMLFGSACYLGSQRHPKISINSEGNREVFDSALGWTVTAKDGSTLSHQSAVEIADLCNGLDRPVVLTALTHGSDGGWPVISQLCENWAEVQPQQHIERMSFAKVMTRLLAIAPPSTSFTRYRGMELKTDSNSTTYDATLIPSDLGYEPACTVEEENRHAEGMLYTYECSVKTASFPAALQLKDRLVEALSSLRLTDEDEVREHGLAANARNLGYCAPDGECMEGHIYVTTTKAFKAVQIEPNPILTRNTLAEVKAMQSGRHAPITGIANDSANLTFRVLSVGPGKANERTGK